MRYVMPTSENQTGIFSEEGKRMGQLPFLWELPAEGNSYVLQSIGEWAAVWMLDLLVGHGARDVEMAGLLSPHALPSSGVWLQQTS